MLKVLALARETSVTVRPALVAALAAVHASGDRDPRLRGFVVSEVAGRTRGDLVADVIAEEWWGVDDPAGAEAAAVWASARQRLQDAGAQAIWLTREHVLRRPTYDDRGTLEGGAGQKAGRLKMIGTAYPRDDFTLPAFFDYWFGVHAPISGAVPGLDGYIVCEVLQQAGDTAADAFVEQWWPDQATLDAATVSPEVAVAWEDVQKYAKTTGTFWVAREQVFLVPPYPRPGLLER